LRWFTEDDADNLVALNSDPAVMRFLNGGKPLPREVVQSEILPRFLQDSGPDGGLGVWAAIEKASGAFLGWISLRQADGAGTDEAELGYRLRRSAWGRGYATEGARALIRKGFAELGVRRVVAHTMTVNRASRRVMEKLGLTLVRTFFEEWPEVIEGGEYGDVEYALSKADWERLEHAPR
jgi:RimJ/RimL family protein N-acetyltransferase